MKKKRISFMVVVAMAAMLLATTDLNAQEGRRGLFNRGSGDEIVEDGIMQRKSRANLNEEEFTNANFGEVEAPLGSGIAVLLAAGLGYAALKRKEEKQ